MLTHLEDSWSLIFLLYFPLKAEGANPRAVKTNLRRERFKSLMRPIYAIVRSWASGIGLGWKMNSIYSSCQN